MGDAYVRECNCKATWAMLELKSERLAKLFVQRGVLSDALVEIERGGGDAREVARAALVEVWGSVDAAS